MTQFLRIAHGIDTMPVLLELNRSPGLWDGYSIRRTFDGTPHAEMTDIFVRFRPRDQISGPAAHQEEYRNAFWPAWRELPSLRPLVFALMAKVSAVELGSILITKLPPGAEILPHTDRGVWAPEFYNCKAHLTLVGSSISRCGDETVTMRAGEVWTFNNLIEHDVRNPGSEDRIVCIVSMRVEN